MSAARITLSTAKVRGFFFCLLVCSHSLQSTRALFQPLAQRATALAKDALEEYLALPVIETVKDPIGYWDSVLRSSKGNPGGAALARMGLDFLTVPGGSPMPILTFLQRLLTFDFLSDFYGC